MTRTLLTLIVVLFLTSCTEFYFNTPQPADQSNIYLTPTQIRGAWLFAEPGDSLQMEMDSLYVGEDFYHYISRGIIKESKSLLEQDTMVFIIGDQLYYKEDELLNGAFDFWYEKDSVAIHVEDHEINQFGKKAFLRAIEYGYILNLQHESMIDWWQLKFIDLRNPDRAVICNIAENNKAIFPDHTILSSDFPYYLNASWSKSAFKNFIDLGGFSDTLLVLEYNERL